MTGSAVCRIDSGLIAGSTTGRVSAWLGIPFAAAPTGALRFRPPQPVAPWEGVREAVRYGDACVQPAVPPAAIMRQFSFDEPPECGTSEDCLYLNVWAPSGDAGTNRPVIVFLYGGGHRLGSGSHAVSRGDALASRGAVVVTCNYRVGALGYLAHPALTAEEGASGHYACLDVIAALTWVKRNITAFGGDPACVTLFGQSAGGALVNVMMASPAARGLFHRAIVHSSGRLEAGAGPALKSLVQSEAVGVRLAEKWGASSAAELRALAPDAFEAPPGTWSPIVDGQVLNEQVEETFAAGAQADMPLLVGYTGNEASPYPTPDLQRSEALQAYARSTYGERADRFLELFPADTDPHAIASSYALRRDSGFAYQAWKLARLHAKSAAQPVHLFNFMRAVPLHEKQTFREPVPPGGYGAYHGAELWYAFDNLHALSRPWEGADKRLAGLMAEAWIEFARTGRPAAAALPSWPDFRDEGHAMLLDENCRAAKPFNDAALAFFHEVYEARRPG